MVTATLGLETAQTEPASVFRPRKNSVLAMFYESLSERFLKICVAQERIPPPAVVKKMTGIRTETVATRVWAPDIP
jgi:hypothetical protein